MASVRKKKKSPYWFACYTLPDGRRTQTSTGTTNRDEAKRIAYKLEDTSREGSRGKLTEARAREAIASIFAIANKDTLPSSTVEDYFKGWLKQKKLETADKTFDRYQSIADSFLKWCGPRKGRDLSLITAKDIAAYRNDISGRLATGSANLHLKALRVAFGQAVKDQVISENPAAIVDSLKNRDRLARRAFTVDEMRKLLTEANDEWRTMILAGLYTGQRLGDLANLTWSNIDLAKQELTITTQKTGRTMSIHLHPALLRHLENLPAGDVPDAPLARSLYGKRSGTLSNQFHKIMEAACLVARRTHQKEKAGRESKRALSEISFHAIRHTATSLLKNGGTSDAVAMDIIGHESTAISAHYTHIDAAAKRRAVDTLPDITSPA